jgi:predicted acylesterase/phospholipase RssA
MRINSLPFLFSAAFFSSSVSAAPCRALALSGGGSHGSFEAGVMWGMYHAAKDKQNYEYDVVSGVSAGSINSLAVSFYAPGQEEEMLEFMSNAWQSLSTDEVYKGWRLGIVEGILHESGIFDNSPLYDFLQNLYE